ncbi:MAG TPA: phosphatidylserine decarboxylase family protein [Phototrophicaceae bacterium]|jgi:phosphatidylserine decarboxylase|nr:phosphatidylserine decarboxylase family protein [Phototrophicaceae bacterium]
MAIHREGYRSIVLTGVCILLFNLLIAAILPGGAVLVSLIITLPAWYFFIQFFRNPSRITPVTESGIVSPADGTIVAIESVFEGEFFKVERLKISIYMSALNVHLNRIPLTGKVIYTKYHPGKYLVAFHPKSSELNERNTVVMENHQGQQILIRQIAGLLARRIVCYLQTGQSVHAGEELGFIKFGSRCDVFLPLDAVICVQLQQKVSGGETILAELQQ